MRQANIAFLDRDGVINRDDGYTHVFRPDIVFKDLQHLSTIELHQVFIITNQSGIGRGYYSEKKFHIFMERLIAYLKLEFGISITDYFFCPHAPSPISGQTPCSCRKPATGMFLDAQKLHHIDFSRAFMVGDKVSDIQASYDSGIKLNYLINRSKDPTTNLFSLADLDRYNASEIASLYDISLSGSNQTFD